MMEIRNPAWWSEELTLLSESADRLIARDLAPSTDRWNAQGQVERDAWRRCGEAGLLLPGIGQHLGGGGGGHAHEAVVLEAFARAGMGGGLGLGVCVHGGIVAHYIAAYGTPEQQHRWLPPMARGEQIAAIAMTEPGTGSDLQGIRTTARCDGAGYRVSGAKTFISNGQTAELVLVLARTGGEGAAGLSLLMLETPAADGFRRGRKLDKIGAVAQDTSELFFDDVRIPRANLLGGEEGRAFAQLMAQLPWERLQIAIMAAAASEAALAMTLGYATERRAFGRRLIDFQDIQFKLADCATRSRVGRSFVDDCIGRLLGGSLDGHTAAMAKYWLTEQHFALVDTCLQIFGGYGCTTDYPIARLWGDARIGRIYGGTSEIMKTIIARSLAA